MRKLLRRITRWWRLRWQPAPPQRGPMGGWGKRPSEIIEDDGEPDMVVQLHTSRNTLLPEDQGPQQGEVGFVSVFDELLDREK